MLLNSSDFQTAPFSSYVSIFSAARHCWYCRSCM